MAPVPADFDKQCKAAVQSTRAVPCSTGHIGERGEGRERGELACAVARARGSMPARAIARCVPTAAAAAAAIAPDA
ncbi:MAG TPA: hypothetical protein VJR91_28020, partial [Burkholderia sp.]|nr:hypothetical protein [Burkholderia sp.]